MRTYHNIPRPEFTPERITSLRADEVFVFGSNLAGMHGGGAARVAYERFGAVWGRGVGLQGQSYAIPTMQGGVETIKPYVDAFIDFAVSRPDLFFTSPASDAVSRDLWTPKSRRSSPPPAGFPTSAFRRVSRRYNSAERLLSL